MRVLTIVAMAAMTLAVGAPARAGDSPSCLDELDRLGVDYSNAKRRGISIAVEVDDKIGGVVYEGYGRKPLVLDCSLVYSLAVAGRFFAQHGVTRVRYSSAYQRRKIRRTQRWSRHSFGLAIDIHALQAADAELLVKDDYEQGLGDNIDCVGQPLTEGGTVLRTLGCQFARSGLFRIVLDPDYDADHYNHFHVEALPWSERVSQ